MPEAVLLMTGIIIDDCFCHAEMLAVQPRLVQRCTPASRDVSPSRSQFPHVMARRTPILTGHMVGKPLRAPIVQSQCCCCLLLCWDTVCALCTCACTCRTIRSAACAALQSAACVLHNHVQEIIAQLSWIYLLFCFGGGISWHTCDERWRLKH